MAKHIFLKKKIEKSNKKVYLFHTYFDLIFHTISSINYSGKNCPFINLDGVVGLWLFGLATFSKNNNVVAINWIKYILSWLML